MEHDKKSLNLMRDKLIEIKKDMSYETWSDFIKNKTGEYISPSSLHKYVQLKRVPPIDVLEILARSSDKEVKDFFYTKEQEEFESYVHKFLDTILGDKLESKTITSYIGSGKTMSILRLLEDFKNHPDFQNKLVIYDPAFSDNQIIKESNVEYISPTIYQIPIIGSVPAGGPVIVEENLEGYMSLPENLVKSSNDFCLKVHGDSMEDVDINDGDTVLVHPQPTAENGQTVIARINGEVTCKRFYRMNGKCRLEPANIKYKPIDCDELEIIGVVIRVIKEVF